MTTTLTRTRVVTEAEDVAVAVAEVEAEAEEEAVGANRIKAAHRTARRVTRKGTGQINARHPGAAFAPQEGIMPIHALQGMAHSNKPVTNLQIKVTNKPPSKHIKCKPPFPACRLNISMLVIHGTGKTKISRNQP
jgi:hypothetical protein